MTRPLSSILKKSSYSEHNISPLSGSDRDDLSSRDSSSICDGSIRNGACRESSIRKVEFIEGGNEIFNLTDRISTERTSSISSLSTGSYLSACNEFCLSHRDSPSYDLSEQISETGASLDALLQSNRGEITVKVKQLFNTAFGRQRTNISKIDFELGIHQMLPKVKAEIEHQVSQTFKGIPAKSEREIVVTANAIVETLACADQTYVEKMSLEDSKTSVRKIAEDFRSKHEVLDGLDVDSLIWLLEGVVASLRVGQTQGHITQCLSSDLSAIQFDDLKKNVSAKMVDIFQKVAKLKLALNNRLQPLVKLQYKIDEQLVDEATWTKRAYNWVFGDTVASRFSEVTREIEQRTAEADALNELFKVYPVLLETLDSDWCGSTLGRYHRAIDNLRSSSTEIAELVSSQD